MSQIEFVGQTLCGGQQSPWGMRICACQAAQALPHFDRTGFCVVDPYGTSDIEVNDTLAADPVRTGPQTQSSQILRDLDEVAASSPRITAVPLAKSGFSVEVSRQAGRATKVAFENEGKICDGGWSNHG